MSNNERLVLLTGATGYIGSRLLKTLEKGNHRIRCLIRRPDLLRSHADQSTEVIESDVLNADSLRVAMQGVETAYYLVHSMAAGREFEIRDRQAAEMFGRQAREAGLKRIIYLGGLGSGPDLSPHLASRQEVGRILRESGVPTIEFRASIIIGAGSFSYEMIKALVDRLPVMVMPKWVENKAQPIAVDDVIDYLVAALDVECDKSVIFEIGGADRASYHEIMKEYARQRGVARIMIPVPVLTPQLSSLWLKLVTPLYARVGRALIEGVKNPTVVTDESALDVFAIRPCGISEAIRRASYSEDQEFTEKQWSQTLPPAEQQPHWGGLKYKSRFIDTRSVTVKRSPAEAFAAIKRIGGQQGWYFADWLWQIRGIMDQAIGGVGMVRGRSDPEDVAIGDTIDCWRVEVLEPNRTLSLIAEMKLPGRAWLQFEVEPADSGARITKTALFDPIGIMGHLYWYGLYPIHEIIFSGMLRGLSEAIEAGRAVEPEDIKHLDFPGHA